MIIVRFGGNNFFILVCFDFFLVGLWRYFIEMKGKYKDLVGWEIFIGFNFNKFELFKFMN